MTAMAMKGDKEACLEAGMDGYLSKPIRAQELDNVLERYTEQKKTAEVKAPEEPDFPVHEAINVEELWERIGDDQEFLAELTGILREDCPRQLEALHQAVDSQDADGVRRISHALKGALANLSAIHASELAAELEEMSKAEDFTHTGASLKALEAELQRVIYELENLSKETPR
jgi:HPt (histidine-containing phosphotransfer) domain-containing protein